MRSILLAAGAALLLGTASASAAGWGSDAYGRPLLQPQRQTAFPAQLGTDYGTGYYGRGTATGGPAGGLPGRS